MTYFKQLLCTLVDPPSETDELSAMKKEISTLLGDNKPILLDLIDEMDDLKTNYAVNAFIAGFLLADELNKELAEIGIYYSDGHYVKGKINI